MKKFRLEDIEKKEPFEAPDKYFDDFPLRMQKRIESKKAGSFVWHLSASQRWALSSLAAVVIVVIGFFAWQNNSGLADDTDPLAAIATADLVFYLETETISSDELVEVFGQVDASDSLWHDSELNILPQDEMSEEDLLLLYDQLNTQDEIL